MKHLRPSIENIKITTRHLLVVSSVGNPSDAFSVTVSYLRPYYLVFKIQDKYNTTVAEVDYDNNDGIICNFKTDPAYRKQGFGRKLLNTALNHPFLKNKIITLNAKPYGDLNNSLAQEELEDFYNSFGFQHTGIKSPKGTRMILTPIIARLEKLWGNK